MGARFSKESRRRADMKRTLAIKCELLAMVKVIEEFEERELDRQDDTIAKRVAKLDYKMEIKQ
jgi:hypothetical protein